MGIAVILLLVAALVCFVLATFGVTGRISLVPAGLALFTLALLIPMVLGT